MIERLPETTLTQISPVKEFEIGDKKLIIKPLTTSEFLALAKELKEISDILTEKGINAGSFDDLGQFIEAVPTLLSTCADQLPALMEVCTGLHRDDIARLPVTMSADLLLAVIEVNFHDAERIERVFQVFATAMEIA